MRRSIPARRIAVAFAMLVPGGPPPDDLSPHAVRTHLHLHGITNHNGGGRYPGSIQWHVAQAARLSGDDFLWWTEHFEMYREGSLQTPYPLSFHGIGAQSDESGAAYRTSGNWLQSGWVWETTGGGSLEISKARAHIHLPPGGSSVTLRPVSKQGPISRMWFARPLATAPRIEILQPVLRLPRGAELEIECQLSFDFGDTLFAPVFRARVAESPRAAGPEGSASPGAPLLIPIPARGGPIVFDLDSARAGTAITDDHTIAQLRLIARNDGPDSASVELGRVVVSSAETSGRRVLERTLARLDEAARAFGVPQALGGEFRGFADEEHSYHMCAFFPGEHHAVFQMPPDPPADEWTRQIHDRGGLVSLAHVLGTAPRQETDLPADDVRRKRVDREFQALVATRAHGADLFEVGYSARGDGTIEDYLELWDALIASGVEMAGIGVTDAHGSRWDETMSPNSWATWVYAPAHPDSILDALRRRRAYFGDFVRWDGELDLRAGGWRMGDEVDEVPDTIDVEVKLDPAPDDLEVRVSLYPLGQEVGSPRDLRYTVRDRPVAPNRPLLLELRGPSALRAVVVRREPGGAARIVAAGNPILFRGPDLDR